MSFNILEIILIVFLTALVVTVIFRRMQMSVILGYLVVGALVGPHALGLIPDSHTINELAEFGIVFLMFTVGLEFSLPKLIALKFPVFVIGGLQVCFSILITALIGKAINMSTLSSITVGCIVAMSSTAIVVKQLHDQLELHSPHGLNAVGILLFQDLAVIPIIILIAGLAKDGHQSLIQLFLWALVKGIFAIFLIFITGRWLLKPLFHVISKTKAIELFSLSVLLVTLTASWLTHILGLSFALGAFLAGIMLAETEFRHQIEVEIRPFRDILLGLFFITIGMLTNIGSWEQTWIWILLLLSALVFGKMLLIAVISFFTGNNSSTSLRTGLVLAQGGEFGFAILTLALTDHMLPEEYGQVVLAALLLSIALSPLLIYFNRQIAALLLPSSTKLSENTLKRTKAISKKLDQHIVICGYGRVGQHIARLLDKFHFPYVGIDQDSELIERASLAGESVIFGDAGHPDILTSARIKNARALVICVNDQHIATKILSIAKHDYPDLPILVRCRDEFELKQLRALAPTQIIAELYEASLSLFSHLFPFLQIPHGKINSIIQDIRDSDYDLLQKVFTGSLEETSSMDSSMSEQLMPILVPEGAFVVNRKLKDINLKRISVEIVGIRRGKAKQVKPKENEVILANDILILYGSETHLEAAERILLEGE